MPKVTLAMPVYNVEECVERALLSALNQTFEDIEFIIIDDKGDDRSMEIVQQIIESHPRGKKVRIIDHVVNKGTGATKNSAIDAATGEYLFFMDSDDEITPDCIEILHSKMVENPVDLVIGSVSTKGIPSDVYKDITIYGRGELAKLRYKEKCNIIIAMWNKLYSLDFIRRNSLRCVPHHLNEDDIFSTNVLFIAQSCTLISNITYNGIGRENSTQAQDSKGLSKRSADQYIEIFDFHKSKSKEIYSDPLFRHYYNFIRSYMIYMLRLYFKSSDLTIKEKLDYASRLKEGLPHPDAVSRIKFNLRFAKKIALFTIFK